MHKEKKEKCLGDAEISKAKRNSVIIKEKKHLSDRSEGMPNIENEKKIIIEFFEKWVDRPLDKILLFNK